MAAAEYADDDDALFVLTAALLTPGQFPGVLGDDYPSACAGLGLDPLDAGYGLVFGQDCGGARWTVATTDAAMVACALAAWDCGLEYDLSPDEQSVAASLPGWPLPVAVSVPGLPEPHDPDEETGGGPPLTPPDTSVWGPRQRRLGADEIANHWWEWRDQFAAPGPASGTSPGAGPEAAMDTAGALEADAGTAYAHAVDTGAVDTATAASDAANRDTPATPPTVSHGGIRGVLAAAEEYLRTPPPAGRVRTAYGAVRADGPDWSLVGRADDMAFVLLDDMPGEVLPVGRGPSLPPLLEALTRLAAAPQPTSSPV